MPYTTQGYMTAADMIDLVDLYDLDAHKDHFNAECPGHEYVYDGYLTGMEYCGIDETCPEAASAFREEEWDMAETFSETDLADEADRRPEEF